MWSEGHNCVYCVIQQLITQVICSISSEFTELLGLICGEILIAKWYNIRAFIGRLRVQFPLSAHRTLTFHENCLELVLASCTI